VQERTGRRTPEGEKKKNKVAKFVCNLFDCLKPYKWERMEGIYTADLLGVTVPGGPAAVSRDFAKSVITHHSASAL
jgi:hypothetical protein